MQKNRVVGACLAVVLAGCGGGSGSQGYGVGGTTMCGQVAACGGDVTGTWKMSSGCITAAGIKDAEGGSSSSCPGASVGVTSISISGTAIFNADMTYTFTALQEQATYSFNFPGSCLNGLSCSYIASSLESSGDFQSANCSGSSGCSCTAVGAANGDTETGTYTISGNMLTTTSSAGDVSTVPYCVMGSTLHMLDTSTMTMGAMGQAAIDEDTIGIKQQ